MRYNDSQSLAPRADTRGLPVLSIAVKSPIKENIMIKLYVLYRWFAALMLSMLTLSALAQSAAGSWELTEPSGGSAIGRMTLSPNGTIDFDGLTGSWSATGNGFTATLYGDQQLRAANMPAANISFVINGNSASGTLQNLMNGRSNNIGARRLGDSPQVAANSDTPARAAATVTSANSTIKEQCGEPGAINECSTNRPSCKTGEVRVDGKCVKPTITCLAPAVLQDGSCVRPANSSTSGAKSVTGSGNATTNSASNTAADKRTVRPDFKQQPATVPTGVLVDTLTKANGEYNCASVNAYASKHEKESAAAWQRYLDSPYRSEQRCSALCDTLAWREELVSRFRYTGSWSCSSKAVGMWGALGAQFRSYRNGSNGDRCTCIDSNGAPYPFTEESK